jgi:glucosamine--fructose-6-phosphate aminotransferase (isomerizing)
VEKELYDIPNQGWLCYEKNKGLILPEKVPYIGMGSSYFAAVVLRYLGIKNCPELAGEYFSYLKKTGQSDHAVLISQSGRTTDVLNCCRFFKDYTVIVNDVSSPLATMPHVKLVVPLHAGEEKFSSSKTFINTLIALYLGHGFDVKEVLQSVGQNFHEYEQTGEALAGLVEKDIRRKRANCIILGSGPNFGTACQAALMLSESTKFPFTGMSITQYEHGYKETAENSVIIAINPSKSILYDRCRQLLNLLKKAGATVFEIRDPEFEEIYTPFTSIIPFYFMASSLARRLGVEEPFQIGNKVTERTDR